MWLYNWHEIGGGGGGTKAPDEFETEFYFSACESFNFGIEIAGEKNFQKLANVHDVCNEHRFFTFPQLISLKQINSC